MYFSGVFRIDEQQHFNCDKSNELLLLPSKTTEEDWKKD